MYKFGFIFRNWPTNVRKLGKGVSVPCGAPILRLGGGIGALQIMHGREVSISTLNSCSFLQRTSCCYVEARMRYFCSRTG